MREYQLAKQHMAQQVQYAETMRQIKKAQPLYKRLTAFLSQDSTATKAKRESLTATQSFKPTTTHS